MKNASAVQLVALPTPPASAVAGSLYYSNGGTLKWFNGSAWRTATADEDAGTVTGPKTFARATVGQGAGTAGILELARTQVATSGVTTQDSSVLRLTSSRWNGTASVDESIDVTLKRRSATAADHYVNVPEDVEVTGYLNGSTDVRVGGRSLGRGGMSGGLAQITADSTGVSSTTVTAVSGLSVTVTVPTGGRRLRLNFYGGQKSTVAGDRASIVIREGTTNLQIAQTPALAAVGSTQDNSCSIILDATAGSHTYLIAQQRVSGTGTVTITGSATIPAQLFVEDMGPTV